MDPMVVRWYYSLVMLLTYLSVFVLWKIFPSRASFLGVGAAAVIFLSVGLVRAVRNRYFVNRVDLFLHAYVIVDLLLESTAFELFRLTERYAVMKLFHDNLNFLGCTLVFVGLIGGYRWFAMRRHQRADGAAYGEVGV